MAIEKILVVDDDSLCRDLLQEILTDLGYEAYAEGNPLAALDRLGREDFDLLISGREDHRPGLDATHDEIPERLALGQIEDTAAKPNELWFRPSLAPPAGQRRNGDAGKRGEFLW